MRKTKIICTLGPAVDDIQILRELVLNGMDCARLNFSHGSYEEHLQRMNKIRQLREELNIPIPILLDTKGPEIRIGKFEKGFIEINKGQTFCFYPEIKGKGNETGIGITFSNLYKNVEAGTKILVDDGKIGFVVIETTPESIVCKAQNSGRLSDRKSINVPNVAIQMEYMSDIDKQDLLFGIEQEIDFIAASFVRSAQDVQDLKTFLNAHNGHDIKIISKIENTQGIVNLDAIIKASDGIMIARGDMGVEVPYKELPPIQKEIIKKCYRTGKYVITATQMLESMTKNPRPTRAEVSDVANAIYDGTTIIMLSGETAMGDYPIEAVRAMAEIAETTENNINYKKRFETNHLDLGFAVMSAISNAACISAHQINASAIIAATLKGVTAQSIADYRPHCPIIGVTPTPQVCRQLNLSWNTKPLLTEFLEGDEIFERAVQTAVRANVIKKGDMVVIAGGIKKSNLQTGILKIHKV